MREYQRNHGFSFLKSMTFVILFGMVFAAIIVIRNINREFEIRQIAGDFQQYRYATLSFNNIYNGLPGDVANAVFYFKDVTENGNGDKKIEAENSNEGILAWQHLQLSGQLKFSYNLTGKWVEGAKDVLKSEFNVPSGNLKDSIFFFMYNENFGGNLLGFARKVDDAGIPKKAALTPAFATMLDKMVDDGFPNTGNIISTGASDGECNIAGEYKAEKDRRECLVYFKI